MPEYPDITIYIEAISRRTQNQALLSYRLNNPFLLRTAEPSFDRFEGLQVKDVQRMGKRIVLSFGAADDDSASHWLVLHLMIAGRLHWIPKPKKPPGKSALLLLEFAEGWLSLTEAGSKRRASVHLFENEAELQAMDPGGLEVLEADYPAFCAAITASNHTLKRALTDSRILSGIGNAYSDEILHRARLSPIKLTQKLDDTELNDLFVAVQKTLLHWTDKLRERCGENFPEKVTAFREDMAAHGRYAKPCPDCGSPIQRIRYANNETNYCPTCQTEGRLLADRALSKLLKKDWPRTLEEMEKRKPRK